MVPTFCFLVFKSDHRRKYLILIPCPTSVKTPPAVLRCGNAGLDLKLLKLPSFPHRSRCRCLKCTAYVTKNTTARDIRYSAVQQTFFSHYRIFSAFYTKACILGKASKNNNYGKFQQGGWAGSSSDQFLIFCGSEKHHYLAFYVTLLRQIMLCV